MKPSINKLNTINDCNRFFDQTTLHPLVSLIDFSDSDCEQMLQLDFYSVWLKETPKCSCCGWKESDFSDGTIVFLSPNRPINMEIWSSCRHEKGYLLGFHPTLLSGTSLGEAFGRYSFFDYKMSEALHISAEERRIIESCMEDISRELHHGVDEFTKVLLVNKIEMVLNYCSRFYTRQFITRHELNVDLIAGTDKLISNYFLTEQAAQSGLPDVRFFSRMLGLSVAYFTDVLRHETGKSPSEYVELMRLHLALEQILRTAKSVSRISADFAYSSPQHLSRLLKRLTGRTPAQLRLPN